MHRGQLVTQLLMALQQRRLRPPLKDKKGRGLLLLLDYRVRLHLFRYRYLGTDRGYDHLRHVVLARHDVKDLLLRSQGLVLQLRPLHLPNREVGQLSLRHHHLLLARPLGDVEPAGLFHRAHDQGGDLLRHLRDRARLSGFRGFYRRVRLGFGRPQEGLLVGGCDEGLGEL